MANWLLGSVYPVPNGWKDHSVLCSGSSFDCISVSCRVLVALTVIIQAHETGMLRAAAPPWPDFAYALLCHFLTLIFVFVFTLTHNCQEQKRDREMMMAARLETNLPSDGDNKSNMAASALTRIGDDGTLIVPPDFSFKLKIFLAFLQKGVAITSGITIAWPSKFRQFLTYISSFADFDILQTSSVDCVIKTTYFDSFIAMTVLPIAVVILIASLYLLPKKLGCVKKDTDENSAKRSRRRFWKIIIFFLFLIYPSVSAYALGLYDCRDFYGKYLLFRDLAIDCTSAEYHKYSLIGILMIFLYPLGIPLFFISMIKQYRYPKDGQRTSRYGRSFFGGWL
jgi:hypothetical protein